MSVELRHGDSLALLRELGARITGRTGRMTSHETAAAALPDAIDREAA